MARAAGLADVLFPLETMYHDGVLDFSINVNYVRAKFDLYTGNGNWGAWFSPGLSSNTGPFAILYLNNIVSNQPTVILTSDGQLVDIVPDIELTNMSASVQLGRLHPTADKQGMDYDVAVGSFFFDYNVVETIDGLADDIFDVEQKIRTRVSQRIARAFNEETTHKKIAEVLTTLVGKAITRANPAGYATLDEVTASGSSIVVFYTSK
jgi:hypothetical protein